MRPSPALPLLRSVWLALACLGCLPLAAAEWQFQVRFREQVRREPLTGRVYLFFSKTRQEPRTGPGWFQPEAFVARDVRDWKPDEPLLFATSQPRGLLAFPRPLQELELSGYRVQAVARFNPHERQVGTGPGNGYSQVLAVPAEKTDPPAGAAPPLADLVIDRLVPERRFGQTNWTRLLRVRSQLLSDFHGRDVHLQAAVTLPASYPEQLQRRYPAIFIVPGFGGTHFEGVATQPHAESNPLGVEFLRVTLDPSCPLGHHVFADSANNGPVGQALIAELLPEFDRKFRSVDRATGRFLTGHSSGGWSTLWLQVTYPDVFGGVWSTAPDPVDFRDFQRINLYAPGDNMYVDREGRPRPLARRGGRVVLWYREFDAMETVLGYGGQLHSFEAVFSPRGADGRPRRLWDRTTGAIDPAVAKTWEPYDIRLVLERNWPNLQPRLAGKLHVFMGEEDTFYLEGATRLLQESLRKLGSDAIIELHPGKDHGSLLTAELQARIEREMAAAFRRSL